VGERTLDGRRGGDGTVREEEGDEAVLEGEVEVD
jgi:hypothetical protein